MESESGEQVGDESDSVDIISRVIYARLTNRKLITARY